MEYTKGEWEVTKWASHADIHVSVNEGAYMRFVANCGNPLADTLPTNPDAEANARLIAAAPDMYEGLRHTEIVLNNLKVVNFGELTQQQELCLIELNKALSKAEGK